MTAPRPLLEMRGVEKRFGGVQALAGVDLEVREGEIHALVGENGAGKSTLMKILAGALLPDAGTIELDGQPYAPRGPIDALRRGVAMIYQELNLAPDLTITENLVLGREARRLGVVDRRANRARVERVLSILDHPDLVPDRPVRELGPGPRQLVEIGRALVGDARVVILDEPTSSLSATEAAKLDEVIRRLRERRVAIVYISHFLEEVKRIAERYTVLRDGRTVASGNVADASIEQIVEAMAGRRIDEAYPRIDHTPGEVVLRIEKLGGRTLPRDATLELARGEVLGIAGLVGGGRTELLRAIYGLDAVRSGRITIRGATDAGRDVRARIRQGVGMVSEDCKGEGLALARLIAENLTLSSTRAVSRAGVIDRARRKRVALGFAERLGIKLRSPDQEALELSGGNQQKVAIARLLHQDADVLLLDEPTRGIDVASKVDVYRAIGEEAARGKAILLVSSYLPELLGICDRIAVMHKGVLSRARPTAEWTEHALLDAATRGDRDTARAGAPA